MNSQQRENTSERQGHPLAGGDTHSTRAEDVDELFREWKSQRTAFGIVLVAYALLLSVAPLIARYPIETTAILCPSLRHFIDWRAWVLTACVACLIGIAVMALKRRH